MTKVLKKRGKKARNQQGAPRRRSEGAPRQLTIEEREFKRWFQAELRAGRKAVGDRIDTIENRLKGLEAIREQDATNRARRSAIAAAEYGSNSPRLLRAAQEYRLENHVLGMLGQWRGKQLKALPEYRIAMEQREKAQTVGVDASGGFTAPAFYMADMLIPHLEDQAVVGAMGATFLDNLSDKSAVEFTRETDEPDSFWAGEVEEVTDTEVNYERVTMRPHGLNALIPVSNRMLRVNSKATSMFSQRLERSLLLKMDAAAIVGAGTGASPIGLINQPGVGGVDWSAVEFGDATTIQTVSNLLDEMVGALEDANAYGGRMGWIMAPLVRRLLRTAKTVDGFPMFFNTRGNQTATGAQQRFGPIRGDMWDFPYATRNIVDGGTTYTDLLLLADFETLMIGMFAPLAIELNRSSDVAFRHNMTLIKATLEVDFGVQHGAKIAIANDFPVS